MQSTAAYLTPGLLPLAHGSDAFFDDLSTQMAVSQAARRLSRGASGQRAGSAMRVSKPSSASNSPRNSTAFNNRRRTMMNDAYMPPRQQQATDYFSTTQPKSSRPVSWHPSTHLQPLAPQYQHTSYPLSTPSMYADNQDVYTSHPHFSPMMASYSTNTSPASSFSPLPLMYQGPGSAQYGSETWGVPSKTMPYYAAQQDSQGVSEQEQFPTFSNSVHGNAAQTSTDWNSFILHGFNNTSPPTPDSFLPTHQLQPAVTTVSQGYQDLEEPEEEGEILVGMGLYDTPEKYHEDPHLNNYRSTVSSLLGSTFRPKEPQGKGLKLEETWEPPKSDDEDEGEDEEEDAEDE